MEYLLIGHDSEDRMITLQAQGLKHARELREQAKKIGWHFPELISVDPETNGAIELS